MTQHTFTIQNPGYITYESSCDNWFKQQDIKTVKTIFEYLDSHNLDIYLCNGKVLNSPKANHDISYGTFLQFLGVGERRDVEPVIRELRDYNGVLDYKNGRGNVKFEVFPEDTNKFVIKAVEPRNSRISRIDLGFLVKWQFRKIVDKSTMIF